MNAVTEQEKIIRVLNNYAIACDQRDWELFNEVFVENLKATYGGYQFNSRDEIVAIIRNSLGGCGPSQHLLSNHMIDIDNSTNNKSATSFCYLRATHIGLDEHKGEVFEIWCEYHDKLQRFNGKWKIIEREMTITHETGSRAVLKPEKT